MLKYFIAAVALLAVSVDIYIYFRAVRPRLGKMGRRAYIVYAALVDVAVLTALMLYRRDSDVSSAGAMHVIIWVIGLFFLNLVPKLIYLSVSLLDYPAGWIARRRSRIFGWIGAGMALTAGVIILEGLTCGRSRIEVKRVELTSTKLPEAFDGLRVVVFSDLHMGNLMNRDRFMARMVDTINSLKPDIVIQCGDLVNIESRELDARAMEILSGIRSRYGVWAVLGNHDLGFYIADTMKYSPATSLADLEDKQTRMGWHLLVNRSQYIVSNGDSIAISGVNFPAGDHSHNALRELFAGADIEACYKGMRDSTFNIMLSHTPNLWDNILSCYNADLTISGHVHAMQMKFGWGRHIWSPAQAMYRRWSGLYEQAGKYLYVNDGVGYVMYPMRINARPEITLITARRR